MRFSKGVSISAFLISCTLAQHTLAAPVTFDFNQYRPYDNSHTYLGSDGIHSVKAGGIGWYDYVGSTVGSGLSMQSCIPRDVFNPRQCEYQGNAEVELSEVLFLDFTEEVSILSATFSHIDSDDVFTFWSSRDGVATKHFENTDPGDTFLSTFNFDDYIVGTRFVFAPSSQSRYSDFKISSITTSFVSEVPEPASMALLGMGIASLGAIRRRKQS